MSGYDIEKFFKCDFDESCGIVTLVIAREGDKHNSFSSDFILALKSVLEGYIANERVRALILTADGTKVFSTGADISGQFPYLDPAGARRFSAEGQRVFQLLQSAPFVTCAAVNGFALGGGMEIAMSCDFRTASTRARMGLPEINLGLMPGWGGTQLLPRIVGASKALEMILSGEPVGAQQALELGIVSAVFEPDELIAGTKKILAKFVEKGRESIAAVKRAVYGGLKVSLEEGLSLEGEIFGLLWSTPDREEGVKAYFEKRKPKFR